MIDIVGVKDTFLLEWNLDGYMGWNLESCYGLARGWVHLLRVKGAKSLIRLIFLYLLVITHFNIFSIYGKSKGKNCSGSNAAFYRARISCDIH